jgi:hypothetical protein
MGSSTNYNEEYQPESPQIDGTPDGVDLADAGGEKDGESNQNVALRLRLATVNPPVWRIRMRVIR